MTETEKSVDVLIDCGSIKELEDGGYTLSFSIRPVGQHIIVKTVDDGEYKSESGFILPRNFHQKPMTAKVVEISEDFDNSNLKLNVGDTVLLPKYGSTKITKKDGEYHIAHRKDILGVL